MAHCGLHPHLDEATALECRIRRMREALESIANNTCCEGCQEAAKVARAALNPKPLGFSLGEHLRK